MHAYKLVIYIDIGDFIMEGFSHLLNEGLV